MKYKAIKGLSCDPYRRSITGGTEFDNKVEKLTKEQIEQAISEKRIIPVQTKEKSTKEKIRPLKKY